MTKAIHSPCVFTHRMLGSVVAGCLSMVSAPAWGLGLAGDQVQGSLILPWAPEAGNWFSIGTDGRPISSVPISAIVGPGVEFGYYPQRTTTFTWSVTADLSEDRIRINESYSDPNPGSTWLVEITSWTLTLSSPDWAGAPGISNTRVVSQDPHISLLGFDAHSVQFYIEDVVLYPTGPYSYSRTTVVELAAVPEPSAAALLLCAAAAALWRRERRR